MEVSPSMQSVNIEKLTMLLLIVAGLEISKISSTWRRATAASFDYY